MFCTYIFFVPYYLFVILTYLIEAGVMLEAFYVYSTEYAW